MKIIKSTEKEKCTSLVAVKRNEEKSEEKKLFNFFAFIAENKRRSLVVACCVLLIGTAIFLNWKLFSNADGIPVDSDGDQAPSTELPVSNPASDNETYFAISVIERARARDEAVQVLQNVIDSEDANENDKSNASKSLTKIAGSIEKEANIETLLRSKGFTDCIAIIDGDSAKVIIGTDESLMVNEIAQITEIVWSSAGILPKNLVISEKKPVA